MSDPVRLYTANEIGTALGLSRHWVLEHMLRADALAPEFEAFRGKVANPLWTVDGVTRWRAYHAGPESIPRTHTRGYSDHSAVNQVGNQTVTWKLWWRCTHDGETIWWFSTPEGWYVSDDHGLRWKQDEMIRPSDYHYYCVNGSVRPASALASVLRSTEALRRGIERGHQ